VGKASVKVEGQTDQDQIPALFIAGLALVRHPPLSPPRQKQRASPARRLIAEQSAKAKREAEQDDGGTDD
jgi:hypothetical protein